MDNFMKKSIKKLFIVPIIFIANCTYYVNFATSQINPIIYKGSMYDFEDSLITINWNMTYSGVGFELKNKTNKTMKILWDECGIVDISNTSHRVAHEHIFIRDIQKLQPPIIIQPGSIVKDGFVPVENIYFNSVLNQWVISQFFPVSKYHIKNKTTKTADSHLNKIFKVLLSIENEDTKKEYFFDFKISGYDLYKIDKLKTRTRLISSK